MWEELRMRYKDNVDALNIISDLEALFQKWNDIPTSFWIDDYDPELTKLILASIGYDVTHINRIPNPHGTFSLCLVTIKKVSWEKLRTQYNDNLKATPVINFLKELYQKGNCIPSQFSIDKQDLEITKLLLLDMGYVVVKYDTNSHIVYTVEEKEYGEMWIKLGKRYRSYSDTANIIRTLKPLHQKWNGIPRSFYVGDVNLELLKSILSDLGYVISNTKRTPIGQDRYSVLIYTSEK